MRLVVGLRPDPLRELTALPRSPSWIKEGKERGNGSKKGERKGEGSGIGREGEYETEDSQCLKWLTLMRRRYVLCTVCFRPQSAVSLQILFHRDLEL